MLLEAIILVVISGANALPKPTLNIKLIVLIMLLDDKTAICEG